MKEKLKLNLEDLQVESFDTLPGRGGRGTVFGQEHTVEETCNNMNASCDTMVCASCPETCPTCNIQFQSCDIVCGGTDGGGGCVSGVGCATFNATCGESCGSGQCISCDQACGGTDAQATCPGNNTCDGSCGTCQTVDCCGGDTNDPTMPCQCFGPVGG